MDKSISFGYNAVLSIREDMLNRLVESFYDKPDFTDTFNIVFSEEENTFVKALHGLLSRPVIKLDSSHSTHKANLILPHFRIVLQLDDASKPGAFLPTVPFELGIPCNVIQVKGTDKLKLDFQNVSYDDLTIIPSLQQLPEKLSDIFENSFDNFLDHLPVVEISIGNDFGALDADRFDFIQLSGKDAVQSINFGLYAVSSPGVNNIPFFLESGSMFTLRISESVSEQLISDGLKSRFLRFNDFVKNTDTVYVSDEGATILKISKPDDYEKVKISAYGLSRLSGDITVVGMSTGEEKKYKFSTDEYGSYEVTITARVGDAVEIFGVSVKDSDETYGVTTTTYYPQRVSFEAGYVQVEGKAKILFDNFQGLGEYEIHYSVKIELKIDPASGGVIVNVKSIDLDLGGLEHLLRFVKVIKLGDFDTESYRNKAKSIIRERIEEYFSSVNIDTYIKKIEMKSPVCFFPENIKVQRNGLIIYGSMDVAHISAGRTKSLSLEIDIEEFYSYIPEERYAMMPGKQRTEEKFKLFCVLYFDPDKRKISVINGEIEDLGVVDFASLGITQLSNEQSRNFKDSIPAVPENEPLKRRVFAVRTRGGNYAKVRIDEDTNGAYCLRWVTYPGPLLPKIKMAGEYRGQILRSLPKLKNIEWTGADRYFIDPLWLVCTRLYHHLLAPLQVKWDYAAPVTVKENTTNPLNAAMNIYTSEMQGDYVNAVLKVNVKDIFGRSAEETREFYATQVTGQFKNLEEFAIGHWKVKIIPEVCRVMIEGLKKLEQKAVRLGEDPKSIQALRLPFEEMIGEIENVK